MQLNLLKFGAQNRIISHLASTCHMQNVMKIEKNLIGPMDLHEVITALNKYAPLTLSESWDNTGLLLEPTVSRSISNMLLTIDLTQDVMKEAEESNTSLIVAYHPPLFQPLKRITKATWKGKIIGRCLSAGIAVYSPHTCYDALEGGINDWLISAFGKGISSPILRSHEQGVFSHHIKIYSQHSGMSADYVQQIFSSNLKDQETLNQIKVVKGTGMQVDVFCNEKQIPAIVSKISEIQTDIDHYKIYKIEKTPISNTGMGRRVKLDNPVSVSEAVNRLKKHLNLTHVRLSLKHGGSLDDVISTIAVCAGAGSTVLQSVSADLYITGEMRHHEVLHLAQSGITTILTDHSNSERGFLTAVLKPDLQAIFRDKVNILVSETDCDPLKIV